MKPPSFIPPVLVPRTKNASVRARGAAENMKQMMRAFVTLFTSLRA
jgi:hypothetical protein